MMNQRVADHFFKQTGSLPPDEQITTCFSCTLNANVQCPGQFYCGDQAVYFYSKINYKTLVGKSTKIRLYYRDIASFASRKADQIFIKVQTKRTLGQDLRSSGSEKYEIPSEYLLCKFSNQARDECVRFVAEKLSRVNQIPVNVCPISTSSTSVPTHSRSITDSSSVAAEESSITRLVRNVTLPLVAQHLCTYGASSGWSSLNLKNTPH